MPKPARHPEPGNLEDDDIEEKPLGMTGYLGS